MKKILLMSVMSLALGITTVYANPAKFGTVDMQAVMQHSAKVAAMQKKLQNTLKPEQKKLAVKQAKLKSLVEKYKRDSAIMKKADVEKMESTIMKKRKALIVLSQNLQQKAEKIQHDGMMKVVDDIKAVIKKVAHQKEIDVVLPDAVTLYDGGAVDITPQVQKMMK